MIINTCWEEISFKIIISLPLSVIHGIRLFLSIHISRPFNPRKGRFENLETDYTCVREKLNIGSQLKHYRKSKRSKQGYRDFYDKETQGIIKRVYAKDIDLFGYEF
tara:strand:- start:243 stop:560 length:318 start_codon:yes stop_codon:yes gene_type:complete